MKLLSLPRYVNLMGMVEPSHLGKSVYESTEKYPFWQMKYDNKRYVYACLNYGEAFCSEKINDRSICIDGDIGEVPAKLK